MQPLDVGCFGVFTKSYKTELRRWMLKYPTKEVDRKSFWEILITARNNAYTAETIVTAWRKSGCYPVNRWRGAPTVDRSNTSTPHKSTSHVGASKTIATPLIIKSLATELKRSFRNNQPDLARDLIYEFENLALQKVTRYRDINAKSGTLTELRNGKILPEHSTKLDMRYMGKSRIMDRREVLRQQVNLQARDEKARLKDLKKKERESALEAKEKTKNKRVRIILHVRPKPPVAVSSAAQNPRTGSTSPTS